MLSYLFRRAPPGILLLAAARVVLLLLTITPPTVLFAWVPNASPQRRASLAVFHPPPLLLDRSSSFQSSFPPKRSLVIQQLSLNEESPDDPHEPTVLGQIDRPDSVPPNSHGELMYALGVNLARQLGDVRPLVQDGQELAQVAKGLLDTIVGRLSDDGQKELLARRGKELNTLISQRADEIRQKLESAGREMLQEMAQQEGAVVLEPSGVVVHVLEKSSSDTVVRPTKSSTVKIHYHGTLADGTIFDSTLTGEPVSFPLAGVIPGWREGVLKMKQGETAMVGIPPEQGYGEAGTPDGRIPGGSTLFFKIQLIEVQSAGITEGGSGLIGVDGKQLQKSPSGSSGLLGADGKPLG